MVHGTKAWVSLAQPVESVWSEKGRRPRSKPSGTPHKKPGRRRGASKRTVKQAERQEEKQKNMVTWKPEEERV